MATWHQLQNPGAIAAAYAPKPHVWKVIIDRPNALMYSMAYDNEAAAKKFAKKADGIIINPPEFAPFIIRRKWYPESKSWELFAVFPTIPALSSQWYEMQAQADNGDHFACGHEFFRTSRNIRGHDPKAVAEFEARVRRDWESDPHPLSLIRYERVHASFADKRKAAWHKGRN